MYPVLITPKVKATLKRMWEIDEKIKDGEITPEEKEFYNKNMYKMVVYYNKQLIYWNSRPPIK